MPSILPSLQCVVTPLFHLFLPYLILSFDPRSSSESRLERAAVIATTKVRKAYRSEVNFIPPWSGSIGCECRKSAIVPPLCVTRIYDPGWEWPSLIIVATVVYHNLSGLERLLQIICPIINNWGRQRHWGRAEQIMITVTALSPGLQTLSPARHALSSHCLDFGALCLRIYSLLTGESN